MINVPCRCVLVLGNEMMIGILVCKVSRSQISPVLGSLMLAGKSVSKKEKLPVLMVWILTDCRRSGKRVDLG